MMLPDSVLRGSIREGARDALPVAGVYATSGIALGVLARQAALGPGEVGLMSLLVYAGSTQFAVIGLLIATAPLLAILSTTLLLSLRSLTYGTSLAPYLTAVPRWKQLLVAFGLTDEAFALAVRRFRTGRTDYWYMVGVVGMSFPAWVVSTIIGAGLGQMSLRPEAFGLDVAFPAIFLGLVLPALRARLEWLTAGVAVFLALTGRAVLPEGLVVMAAGLLAPLAALMATKSGPGNPSTSNRSIRV